MENKQLYYIKHKFLNSDNNGNYLGFDEVNETYKLRNKQEYPGVKTRFTKQELLDIKNLDLWNSKEWRIFREIERGH